MIFQNDRTDLFDLVRLCLRRVSLEVDQLFDPAASEDEMTSSAPFNEAKVHQQMPQIVEPYVRVSRAVQHLIERLLCSRHVSCTLPCRA